MAKTKVNYQSLDALKPIARIINDASEALLDNQRTIVDSAIPEIIGAIGGGAIGGVVAGGLIYSLGIVGVSASGITTGLSTLALGLGMIPGIGVAAIIVAAPAVGGYALINGAKKKKLNQEKERLYNEALLKNSEIINELQKQQDLTKERMDYLHSLNVLLQRAIVELKSDLDAA